MTLVGGEKIAAAGGEKFAFAGLDLMLEKFPLGGARETEEGVGANELGLQIGEQLSAL